uniref:Cas10/Cmr2 second palm domain-containing protein n=1 Tax=Trichocoleus desertorum TaxID=1481672 RepID=UPI0025B372AA|nr:type III-B CRISPR-associated protein Cas10/Cmr2 [Trichocoleus desertorum]
MTDTTNTVYTAITFAPVQGFIEKSRKLRDLFGSSFILSYLAQALCAVADDPANVNYQLISPALINVTQGTPNQILIAGLFPEQEAKEILNHAWLKLTQHCRIWIEEQLPEPYFHYCWKRDWSLWTNHAWEFFWATGRSITEARENLNEVKRSRDWTGINWTGESSTLSGADAVAFPGMSRKVTPKQRSQRQEDQEIQEFYQRLSQAIGEALLKDIKAQKNIPDNQATAFYQQVLVQQIGEARLDQEETHIESAQDREELYQRLLGQTLGEAILTQREQVSIPELIKRLVTLKAIAQPLNIKFPDSFKSISQGEEDGPNRSVQPGDKPWKGWFCGDGDKAGDYLKQLGTKPDELDQIHHFSKNMRLWGKRLEQTLRNGRIIYAGGDDFLGVFNRVQSKLKAQECLDWFYNFQVDVWDRAIGPQQGLIVEKKPITASVGFVWAAPNVPQREVLQHCREAEKSAKQKGRDRLALRVLFNSGNHLEWTCPWRFLPILQDYCDRTPHNGKDTWAHIYNDVAILESRHAFQGRDATGKVVDDGLEVALALFNVYFDKQNSPQKSLSYWQATNKDEFYNLMAAGLQACNQPDGWKQFFRWDGLWNSEEIIDPTEPTKKRLKGGILGDRTFYTQDERLDGVLDISKAKQAFTSWIINLAKVGFHLCSDT